MLRKLKQNLARHLINWRGWSTQRKIIVIESDDWGSIRMPSKNVYERFLDKGIKLNRSPYCKFDSLASEDDLEALFNVLTKYQDINNNHPILTANTVVANPDFKKIKNNGFQEYFYEPFTTTLNKYPCHADSFKKWEQASNSGLFFPQFHGREHINVLFWLKLLRQDAYDFRLAFKNRFWGISNGVYPNMNGSIQASYDGKSAKELEFQKQAIVEGLKIFEDIFGFRSQSFVANNYIWSPNLNPTLKENGVDYVQGMKCQIIPQRDNQKELVRRYFGELNSHGQINLVRNVVFEPSLKENRSDSVSDCLKGIQNAFFWNRPAVITSHRINYIGFIEKENRYKNLRLLDLLLKNILDKWPNAEFMSSNLLGQIIQADIYR